MLVQIYPKLKENLFINMIRKVMDSKCMAVVLVALAAISNIFALEIPVYYCYTIMIVLVTLFNDDMLSLVPISCCGYMTFSKRNNPLAVDQTSVFLTKGALTHMLIIGITIAIFAISRIIFDVIKHKDRRTKPKFLYGFIALGLVYILGGLFSSSYSFKTAFFGLIQILALFFTYFCFYYSVDWKKVSKDYFPFLFTLIGFLIVLEIGNMLIDANLFSSQVAFNRKKLFTGWGHYNNIASICLFCIPAPFYFALTRKNGWKYTLISTLFLIATIFNQSRNGLVEQILRGQPQHFSDQFIINLSIGKGNSSIQQS